MSPTVKQTEQGDPPPRWAPGAAGAAGGQHSGERRPHCPQDRAAGPARETGDPQLGQGGLTHGRRVTPEDRHQLQVPEPVIGPNPWGGPQVPKPTDTPETSKTASVSPDPKPGQKKPVEAAALVKARLRTPTNPAPVLGAQPTPPSGATTPTLGGPGCEPGPWLQSASTRRSGPQRGPGHSLGRLGALQYTGLGSGLGAS